MIQATEADLGRRVIYDPEVEDMPKYRGTLVAIDGRSHVVRFDFDGGELSVLSNLHWADR